MKVREKCMSLLLCLVMLAGCSGREAAESTVMTKPPVTTETAAAEPAKKNDSYNKATFSLATDLIRESGDWTKQWGKDPISRTLEELTGVTLVTQYTAREMDSELAVMKASGEWTDLVFIRGTQDFDSLCSEDYCYDIHELAEEYCPEFWNSLDPMEWLGNMADDGHIYSLRNGSTTQKALNDLNTVLTLPRGLHINETALKKLGRDVPSSIEELETLLYEVNDRRGELEQKNVLTARDALELPLAEWMGLRREVYWDKETKSVRLPILEDGWEDYLYMLNRWYRDGILTFDGDMGFAESIQGMRLNNCETGYGIEVDTLKLVLDRILIERPLTWQGEIRYDPKLVDLGADPWLYNQKSGLFITRNCSNPQMAMELIRYLKSEDGAKLVRWGIEGEYYVLKDKAPQFSEDMLADEGVVNFLLGSYSTKNKIHSEMEREKGVGIWQMMTDGMVEGMSLASPMYVTNENLLKAREMSARAGKIYKEYVADDWNTALGLTIPTRNMPDTFAWYEKIMKIWENGVDQVVRAESLELAEKAWDTMVEQMELQNVAKLEQLMGEKYMSILPLYQAEGLLTEEIVGE